MNGSKESFVVSVNRGYEHIKSLETRASYDYNYVISLVIKSDPKYSACVYGREWYKSQDKIGVKPICRKQEFGSFVIFFPHDQRRGNRRCSGFYPYNFTLIGAKSSLPRSLQKFTQDTFCRLLGTNND